MNTTKTTGVLQPYLFFEGRCEEAIEFYKQALGAELVMMMRYKESPDQSMTAGGIGDKVMHANVRIGQTNLLMSDGRCQRPARFEGFALSLTATDELEADRLFAALSNGGKVQMPLAKTFFSPRFGMLADRFGVLWMIYVIPTKQ